MEYILGSGICGYGAAQSFKSDKKLFKVYAKSGKRQHLRLPSKWREAPVVSNTGQYGLSRYYHGVSPASLLSDPLALRLLKIDEEMPSFNKENYYMVLKKPIRPKFKRINDINQCTQII